MKSSQASAGARPNGKLATFLSVAALLFSVALLLTGHGLQQTLLPIRGGLEGFSAIQIGLLGSFYFAGFVVGCLVIPYAIIRAGHIRTFAALVAVASCAALMHAIIVDAHVWMICRAVTGLCLAGLYLVIESWLNERADNNSRGTVMAAYITINLTVITIGQMIVPLFDPQSFVQLSIAAILMSLAAVPVAMTTSKQPAPVTIVRFRPKALYLLSPAGVVAVFAIGLSNGAFWSLAPSYGQQSGLTVAQTAIFMSLAVIGGASVQYPLGLLSDRMDRRYVMIGLSVGTIVMGALLTGFLTWGDRAILVLAFLFGAVILPGYTIATAHVFDHAQSEGYVEISASLLLVFGIGSVVGPIPASAAMQMLQPAALFGYMALVHAALIGFLVYRLRRREALPSDAKEEFNLATTGPVVAVADAEAFQESPLVVDPTEPLTKLPDAPLEAVVPPEPPEEGDTRTR